MTLLTKKSTHRAIKYAGAILLTVVCLAIIVLNTLSYTLPIFAHSFFEKHQIHFEIQNLTIKPFRGVLSFSNFSIANKTSNPPLSIGQLDLAVDIWSMLRQQKVHINKFIVQNAVIPIATDNQEIYVAGIDPQRFTSNAPEANSPASPNNSPQAGAWHIVWDAITLKNIAFIHTDNSTSSSLKGQLNRLKLGSFSTLTPDATTTIQLSLDIEGIKLKTNGKVIAANSPSGTLDTSIQHMSFDSIKKIATHFSTVLPEQLTHASAVFEYSGVINFDLGEQPSIKIKGSTITAVDFSLPLNDTDTAVNTALTTQHMVQGKLGIKIKALAVWLSSSQFSADGISTFDTQLHYLNGEHTPPTELDFNDIVFELDKIDSSTPKQLSTLNLALNIGEFGKLSMNGESPLLNFEDNTQLNISGEQINLTLFGGLASNYLNRTIEKGALDLNLSAVIKAGNIDSNTELNLHQFSFAASTEPSASNKESAFDTQLGIPLNTALNLLRDKHDSIQLQIPISGLLNDPKIHLNQIINKAILNTLKTAVLTQLGPLMAVSAFDKLKSLSDAAKLKPIIFTQGQARLNNQANVTLNDLAAFLTKRSRIYLNVCAYATASELADIGNEKNRKARALELAKQRANATKEYLIAKNIAGARLILCAAEIDPNIEAQPRVDFSL